MRYARIIPLVSSIISLEEKWPGDNVIVCKGSCFMGPSYYAVIISFCLVLIPGVVFVVFPAYVSPLCVTHCQYFATRWNWAILGVSILLVVICTISEVLTGVTDPGVVPRQVSPHTMCANTM